MMVLIDGRQMQLGLTMNVITQFVMILTLFTCLVNADAAIVTDLEHQDLILKPGTVISEIT